MSESEIRFKNLRDRAREIIKTRDDGRPFTDEFSIITDRLLRDAEFWEHQTEGLLVCMRPGLFETYHLPIATQEHVVVADHLHLAPILGLLNDFYDYYVLAVTQHAPALFKGDEYGLYPTNVKLPGSLKAGLGIDEMYQKGEQQRSAQGSSLHPAGFDGRGGVKGQEEPERLRFWRMIDRIILKRTDHSLPLILAGVGSEVAEYRDITVYPSVTSGYIEGGFSGVQPHDLFVRAIGIIRDELVQPKHHEAVERYDRLSGRSPELAAHEIAAINKAATEGRIDTLLLDSVSMTADTVQESMEPMPKLVFPPEEAAQAINDIVYEVWNASGTVIDIEDETMPIKGAELLAVLRY